MASKFTRTDYDRLVALYRSGMRAPDCAKELGMNERHARRIIAKGVSKEEREQIICARMTSEIRGQRRKRAWDVASAEKRAEIGHAISRGMFEKMTVEQRLKIGQQNGSKTGRRGKPERFEKKVMRAKTAELTLCYRNETEDLIADRFAQFGIHAPQQIAVGPYLCDFALNGVAVEIVRQKGCASVKPNTFEERTRYIFAAGWQLLFVWLAQDVVGNDIVEHILSNANDLAASLPKRRYRIIRGTGEILRDGAETDGALAFAWKRVRRRTFPLQVVPVPRRKAA